MRRTLIGDLCKEIRQEQKIEAISISKGPNNQNIITQKNIQWYRDYGYGGRYKQLCWCKGGDDGKGNTNNIRMMAEMWDYG